MICLFQGKNWGILYTVEKSKSPRMDICGFQTAKIYMRSQLSSLESPVKWLEFISHMLQFLLDSRGTTLPTVTIPYSPTEMCINELVMRFQPLTQGNALTYKKLKHKNHWHMAWLTLIIPLHCNVLLENPVHLESEKAIGEGTTNRTAGWHRTKRET